MDCSDRQAHASANRRLHRLPAGAEIMVAGVRFRAWAPAQQRLALEVDGESLIMERLDEGWHEVMSQRARAGSRYRFQLMDGSSVPDPCSRYQPDDVHGSSEVIDPRAYVWRVADWRGRPWEEAVLYELHVGVFTPEGTFRSAIDRLDHLVALGVTAIEVMPVADFPGQRNWGYDGVYWFAPDSSYGRPEEFKALIDAAHARGIMVLLDVVYNHFGPEGNYLPALAPEVFTQRHRTPWGAAINLDGPGSTAVRELVIHNALYWIEEFNLDGLRLDAVHALADDSARHVLDELAARVHAAIRDRAVHLLLENHRNEARRLARAEDGSPRAYTAQWNDDVHHVLHTAATAQSDGYYQDYCGNTPRLGRALAEGFAFQGERMVFSGEPRGEPCVHLPPTAFVAFIQNHDQVGNRAFGERIGTLTSARVARALAAVYLLLPQIPLLFMGEEWDAQQPFLFFTALGPELANAVREGRRAEFARFPEFRDPEKRARIPDPQSPATFASAKLSWDDLRESRHAQRFEWYCRVLQVRREEIVPRLRQISSAGSYLVIDEGAVLVRWQCADGAVLTLAANLSHRRVRLPHGAGRLLWHEGPAIERDEFDAWTVRWSIEDREDER